MTETSIVLVCLAGLVSVIDWVAVALEKKSWEYVAKPSATILFLLTAVSIDASSSTVQVWRCIALVFCLAGDVFLMLPKNSFVQGLGSFAVAQILLAVSFVVDGPELAPAVIAGVIALGAVWSLSRRFIGALRRHGRGGLIVPVVVYMTVITVMVVSAASTGPLVAIVGAVLFMVSDSLIAEHRFVTPRRWQSTVIMVTYHAALAGLVLGLV